MKFSALVTEVGHEMDHIDTFTIAEGEDRILRLKRSTALSVFCENLTKEEVLTMVKEDGSSIQYVPYALCDDEVKTAALNNDPSSFQYMKNSSNDIIDLAVQLDGMNLQYLDTIEKTMARCVTASRQNFSAIRYCNPAVFDDEETGEAAQQPAGSNDAY